MKQRFKRAMATALTLALAASAVPMAGKTADAAVSSVDEFALTGTDAASGSATGIEAVRSALNNFAESYRHLGDGQSVKIEGFLVQDVEDLAKTYARDLAYSYKGLKFAKPVYVEPNDAILITLAKKTLRVYDITNQVTKEKLLPSITVKKVTDVRKESKKSFAVKQVKGKTVTYTTYKLNSKLKKQTSYSKKKNAGAFQKFEKSFKKMKKFKLTKATPENIGDNPLAFYDASDESYISKDLYWTRAYIGKESKITVMRHDAGDTANPYSAYAEDGTDLIRYVLGPDVVNPATGLTYQAKDWNAMVAYQMDVNTIVSPYYDEVATGAGDYPLKLDGDPSTGIEVVLPDGSKTTVTRYVLVNPDIDVEVDIDIYETGKLRGKIALFSVGSYLNSATAFHRFSYDYTEDGQWIDPMVNVYCVPPTDFASEPTRSLTIHYEGTDASIKDWTVTTADNVRFDFPWLSDGTDIAGVQGGFYLKTDKGTDKLPLEMTSEYLDLFEEGLNKKSGDVYTMDENIAKSIYWTAS